MKIDYKVGIVGAGFAGLVAALELKKTGNDSFIIFERAAEIGGTWRDNIYPGCACDVAVHLYSFAGAANPNWSSLYAGQAEILAYMKNVITSHNLDKRIRLNTDIVEARFIQEFGCWQVTDRTGKSTNVSVLLLGLGPLNRPNIPKLEGQSAFNGKQFHTSEWDTSVDLKNKTVAVVGTGASSIQVVPNILPLVDQLVVFQRTAAWITDRNEKNLSEAGKKLHQKFPLLQKGRREFMYWINELFGLGFLGNKTINSIMRWAALRKLRKEVKDPEIRRQLTPNYTIGCKRILRSDDYYPSFNRDNLMLETDPIERFTPNGILTKEGREYKLDVAIFATGFIAADLHLYIRVIGLEGRNLVEEWKAEGAHAYLGTTVSGYPNLALLLGPNTGLGHNSIVHMIESQMKYFIQYLKYLEHIGPGTAIDIKLNVQQAYNDRIQKQLEKTVWASGCKSWYTNANGKNTTLYPGLTLTFRKETKRFDPSIYTVLPTVAAMTEAE